MPRKLALKPLWFSRVAPHESHPLLRDYEDKWLCLDDTLGKLRAMNIFTSHWSEYRLTDRTEKPIT